VAFDSCYAESEDATASGALTVKARRSMQETLRGLPWNAKEGYDQFNELKPSLKPSSLKRCRSPWSGLK
jgi:hypothetical protein